MVILSVLRNFEAQFRKTVTFDLFRTMDIQCSTLIVRWNRVRRYIAIVIDLVIKINTMGPYFVVGLLLRQPLAVKRIWNQLEHLVKSIPRQNTGAAYSIVVSPIGIINLVWFSFQYFRHFLRSSRSYFLFLDLSSETLTLLPRFLLTVSTFPKHPILYQPLSILSSMLSTPSSITINLHVYLLVSFYSNCILSSYDEQLYQISRKVLISF